MRATPRFTSQLPSTQAARLGTACHEVLALAGAGQLPDADDPKWDTAFECTWQAAIAKQQERARANPFDAHWPPAEKWHYYSMRKVATRHLARRLSSRAGTAGSQTLQEAPRSAYDGRLRGRPDVIRRGRRHEIEDYKTGSLTDPTSGELRPAYRQQVLLYAVLEHAGTGSWPERATLIPLEGDPISLAIDPEEAEAAGERAVAGLAAYNGAVEAGTPPIRLASPSPSTCRFCPYAIRCPGFWKAADESWGGEGIVALAGVTAEAHAAERGNMTVRVDVEAGSAGRRQLWLHQIDPERFPAARQAERGAVVAATRLLAAPDSSQLRPSDATRLVVETDTAKGARPG